MTEPIFSYPAHVRLVTAQERSADLLAKAKSNSAYDPTIFDERTPFFWMAEISNDQIDSYYTRMLPSTLRNFAEGARAGVSFLNSHRHYELPFGRSLDGRLEENGERSRVLADFYTLPGLNLNGITTDDFITGVRAGIVSDVSVGFHGGTHFCDICKANYLSWDCPHLAGMKYELQGSEGLVIATVGIDNALLSEVSGVYDGATPDATIIKARQMAEAGELKPDAVRTMEARYRTHFVVNRSFAVAKPQEGNKMDFEQIVNQIREALGIDAKADVAGAVSELLASSERVQALETEIGKVTAALAAAQDRVKELEPQAEDGRAYREDLITEALAEGVRALGDKFNAESYGSLLRGSPLSVIKQMKTDWEGIASARFAGGRQTTDQGEKAPEQQKRKIVIPQSAYKA